ncbi:MAG: long-chain fatty acid--CoA ligase [Actinomyces sp.]|nr:MAG: long-chain fatty acid--CoA ligase [Actinomyces sp.]
MTATDPAPDDRPRMTLEEADAVLTGPGGFFEITTEEVLGEPMEVFANRFRSLRDMLAASAAHGDGEGVYYIFDDERRATFRDNVAHAASLARALTERFGVTPGSRVAICAANCPEWIQTFWATVSLGAVTVAMNGWWKGPEIDHALALTEPDVMFVDRRRAERLTGDPGIPVVVFEDDFAPLLAHDPGADLPTVPIAEDDPAAILFTSGTTGRPKGAIQTHRNFAAYVGCAFVIGARQALMYPPEGPTDPPRALCASPLFHISGLHSAAVASVASGMTGIWTTGRFDPEKVLALTERHRITRWGGVTTQIWRLIEHPRFGDYDVSSVTSIGGGGSTWSPELQRACRAALPHARQALGVGYGLTECAGLATHADDRLLADHPDTVGRPLPTVGLSIRDDEDRELADGEIGNVSIRGPMVTPGYWNDPDATAATIRPGRWLRSGDFGRLEDGLLFLASRRTDLIIRGGENIYPTEIENRLDDHPGVAEATVFGVDHRELGQEVKAVVVPRPGVHLDPTELAEWVRRALADHKVPAHWEIRTEPLPRNASGKVLKHVVAGRADSAFIEE